MQLVLDFDDVVVHTRKRCCEFYNKYYSNIDGFETANPEKNYYWNMKDVCPLINSVQDLVGRDGFYRDIEIYEGASEYIKELSKKMEVTICTTGGYKNIIEKAKYIDENLPFVNGTVFVANVSKRILNMENCIFVDDNANNLVESNAKIKICLSSRVYECNEHWTGLWAKDWDELMEILKEYI